MARLGEFAESGKQCKSITVDGDLHSCWKTMETTLKGIKRMRTQNPLMEFVVV